MLKNVREHIILIVLLAQNELHHFTFRPWAA